MPVAETRGVRRFPNLDEQPVELELRLGLAGDHGTVTVQLHKLLGDGFSSEAYEVTLVGEVQQSPQQEAAVASSQDSRVLERNSST